MSHFVTKYIIRKSISVGLGDSFDQIFLITPNDSPHPSFNWLYPLFKFRITVKIMRDIFCK